MKPMDLLVAVLKHVGHYGLHVAIGAALLLILAGVVAAGTGRRK
jgi:hypothetical protein